MDKTETLALLDEMGIPFEVTEHEAVYTIDDMARLGLGEQGEVCKNLFLRDAKGKRHFLVVLAGEKRADLKALARQLGSTALSFASAERLQRYLGLSQGEVTPLGVWQDEARAVEVVFDRDLPGFSRLGVHPNTNTATVWLHFDDLRRLIETHGNPVTFVSVD